MVKNRKKIEKALLSQLENKKLKKEPYLNLVKDYLSFFDIKEQLIDDIEERGVAIFWSNGGGQEGIKKNDSVQELVKVNGQMLKILSELGLRGVDIKEVDVDDGNI